jgi:hypothetical protein
MIVKKTVRLFPPTWMILRQAGQQLAVVQSYGQFAAGMLAKVPC